MDLRAYVFEPEREREVTGTSGRAAAKADRSTDRTRTRPPRACWRSKGCSGRVACPFQFRIPGQIGDTRRCAPIGRSSAGETPRDLCVVEFVEEDERPQKRLAGKVRTRCSQVIELIAYRRIELGNVQLCTG